MYEIKLTDSYKKRALKFLKKHLYLKEKYIKTLTILENNPFHPSLRLHKLKGNLKDYHSVSIDMSYRITIDFIIEDEVIIPINIGSHDDVY
jgi:mRNA-degrading endonuclease YafQ of YafQ-DinJ toxin-antitoxin module